VGGWVEGLISVHYRILDYSARSIWAYRAEVVLVGGEGVVRGDGTD